jgi:hypothetical protein
MRVNEYNPESLGEEDKIRRLLRILQEIKHSKCGMPIYGVSNQLFTD